MRRGWILVALAAAMLMAAGLAWRPETAQAQKKRPRQPQPWAGIQWIWFDEGDPATNAPAGNRYFRRVFDINRPVQKPVDEAELDITADDAFTVWVNGHLVGSGDNWKRVYRFDVTKHLIHGKNVVAIEAHNAMGSAGLMARVGYVPNGQSKMAVTTDGTWKASKQAAEGWHKAEFDDKGWAAVKVIGPYGKAGPWKGQVWDAGGGDDRFTVPAGFRVEMLAPPNPRAPQLDPRLPFSLINMTFDARGRLLVSQERGPVLLCTDPDQNGVYQTIRPYCTQVKGCQGMCWVHNALLLVGDGPQGTGLYRCRDIQGGDQIDDVQLLHRFQGGMGEHGPHAILHGPDGWLYLVIGNHAHARVSQLALNSPLTRWPTGLMGPDQGKPGTTEDVLLPRLNDARGHAANILAPGGTIWRLDHEGKNMSLVTAGFRNHFDAAFAPDGELFTFDSDMEWDEALPWYRAVRVCHCPPGADFVWRTGAANTPDYYLDSLPPLLETGRGSPVGLEFYDHVVFPEKYHGAYFLADWAIGVIYAVHLKRAGATYQATAEKFCTGAPMNVTDLAVGPDGALYFTLGGRGTQGGIYRIRYGDTTYKAPAAIDLRKLPDEPQPLAAWSRSRWEWAQGIRSSASTLYGIALDTTQPTRRRTRALDMARAEGRPLPVGLVLPLLEDADPEMRAHAVWSVGVDGQPPKEEQRKLVRQGLIHALQDKDAFVRRRACEALVRAGIEPPVDAIWPLLAEEDRFLRTAARLVLQRIDPLKWAYRVAGEEKCLVAYEAIVALCKIDRAAPYAEMIFGRLRAAPKGQEQRLLDYLRTLQLALIHAGTRPDLVRGIADSCDALFPQKDWRANRELAILLAHFRHEKVLGKPAHARLLAELLRARDNRQQQIHYFYCLRLLHEGWTPEQKAQLLAWYDVTRSWTGGHSFTPFLENILRDLKPIFTPEDRNALVARGERMPGATAALLRMAAENELPPARELASLYGRLVGVKPGPGVNDLKDLVVMYLGRKANSPEAQEALRTIASKDPARREMVARALLRMPSEQNWPHLIAGLQSSQPALLLELMEVLAKAAVKPKPDNPAPFRAVLVASTRLPPRDRWKAVELLRYWTGGKQFGADDGDWKSELGNWGRWFAQSFPKEPPLPDVASDKPPESKYKYAELLAFLEKDPAGRGEASRGRAIFEKAQCIKCHKFGKDGEGIGPDLTTLKSRFKRVDVLESIYYPSKVISDQYRSTLIVLKSGKQLTGLAAPQGDTVTVLQSDGTKVMIKKDEVEQQFASLVSVMPEKLLDPLTKQEIADLFAYLETEPK